MELINEDGGLQSMHFEFSEWSHKIEPLEKALEVKENWFFANSTHVVDLAFLIAGKPKEWQSFSKKGTLNWHKNSFFSGAGVTNNGVIFSYSSNWESAGSWELEMKTKYRRLILNPLENLVITNRGQTSSIVMEFETSNVLKMGVLQMTKEFLVNKPSFLCSLEEHLENTHIIYSKMQLN
jgi:hypothetical protein